MATGWLAQREQRGDPTLISDRSEAIQSSAERGFKQAWGATVRASAAFQ